MTMRLRILNSLFLSLALFCHGFCSSAASPPSPPIETSRMPWPLPVFRKALWVSQIGVTACFHCGRAVSFSFLLHRSLPPALAPSPLLQVCGLCAIALHPRLSLVHGSQISRPATFSPSRPVSLLLLARSLCVVAKSYAMAVVAVVDQSPTAVFAVGSSQPCSAVITACRGHRLLPPQPCSPSTLLFLRPWLSGFASSFFPSFSEACLLIGI